MVSAWSLKFLNSGVDGVLLKNCTTLLPSRFCWCGWEGGEGGKGGGLITFVTAFSTASSENKLHKF